jgi:hypothetical protein
MGSTTWTEDRPLIAQIAQRVAPSDVRPGGPVDTDLDTLETALFVKTDDLLKGTPRLAPWQPMVGITPQLSDAELVTLAMMQAMLGFTSEARWLRHARAHLRHLFPCLPKQPGYNKRLRKAAELIRRVTRELACDTTLWTDDVWVVDSHTRRVRPLPRDRQTLRPGRMGRVRLLRQPLALLLGTAAAPGLHPARPSGRVRVDRGEGRRTRDPAGPARRRAAAHRRAPQPDADRRQELLGREFEQQLAELDIRLLRPARKGEPERAGSQPFKPLRQVIESVNETFKGQLDLERHRGRTPGGVAVRVLQRILALTAAIWHNDHTGRPIMRALTAYDH